MKLRIKVLGSIFRALKSSTCLDGRYEFVYDPACRDYDWLVVFDELPVACEELAKAVPEMDWFGRGVRPLERKEDALIPYRYHIAVENHIGVHHWTEKFSDAILCECLPFYAGDPAIGEIFPKECFIPIPIDDPAEAVQIVREAIANGEYEKRREAILEAKRLILGKYNFWRQVIEVIESDSALSRSSSDPSAKIRIIARRELRKHSVFAVFEDCRSHLLRFVGAVRVKRCDERRGRL